jgi:large subunit ribosomal protein L30
MSAAKKTIRVKQVKSGAHYGKRQQATLRGLGLRRLNASVELQDSPEVRGMIRSISHLLKVEE